VYCEPRCGRVEAKRAVERLVVAIADVSHYVKPGERWTKTPTSARVGVLPRRVIPMPAEKLSNGLCSLKPRRGSLAMVLRHVIGAKGEIEDLPVLSPARDSLPRALYLYRGGCDPGQHARA